MAGAIPKLGREGRTGAAEQLCKVLYIHIRRPDQGQSWAGWPRLRRGRVKHQLDYLLHRLYVYLFSIARMNALRGMELRYRFSTSLVI